MWREDELREEAGIGVKKNTKTSVWIHVILTSGYSIKVILNINYYHIVTKMCRAVWLLLLLANVNNNSII